MSRTVSFRCSEELDEYLEDEADRRMTTKSTVAQMLLSERVRQLKKERSDSENVGNQEEDAEEELGVLSEYEDKWKRMGADSQNEFRVTLADGTYKYYKTQEGVENRLQKEY